LRRCSNSASVNETRRWLVEEGGFLCDSDAYNDDLPYYVTVSGQKHLVIPYTLDANDFKLWPEVAGLHHHYERMAA